MEVLRAISWGFGLRIGEFLASLVLGLLAVVIVYLIAK